MKIIKEFYCCFLLVIFAGTEIAAQSAKKVIIGYVGGYDGITNTSIIDASLLTHINYAFVDIKDGKSWLHNESTDTINFRMLNNLKQVNPALKILISVGGWAWSENFSDAVLTASSRKLFAKSSVEIIVKYNLDGVDIDWEYPGMKGEEGNIYRPEDKQNFTLMFKELRVALDSAKQLTGKQYLLTTAVGGSDSFLKNTEMNEAAIYLDYVNLMTYDFSWGIAGHHTNLYHEDDNASSADRTVRAYISAGVPVEKLVMGIAFYGRGGIVATNENKGFNQRIISPGKGRGYSYLKDSLIDQRGYKNYWDKKAKAHYLFNDKAKEFISYDSERSIKLKCRYVKKKQLAGVMFWQYSSDPKGYLLPIIVKEFR